MGTGLYLSQGDICVVELQSYVLPLDGAFVTLLKWLQLPNNRDYAASQSDLYPVAVEKETIKVI